MTLSDSQIKQIQAGRLISKSTQANADKAKFIRMKRSSSPQQTLPFSRTKRVQMCGGATGTRPKDRLLNVLILNISKRPIAITKATLLSHQQQQRPPEVTSRDGAAVSPRATVQQPTAAQQMTDTGRGASCERPRHRILSLSPRA